MRSGWLAAVNRRANFDTFFLLGGVSVTVGQLSVFAALAMTPVSTVAVIMSLQGVLTVIIGAKLLRQSEALTAQVAMAACVIFVGAAILATDRARSCATPRRRAWRCATAPAPRG